MYMPIESKEWKILLENNVLPSTVHLIPYLIIFLGSFGDFDSIEYAQNLKTYIDKNKKEFNFRLIGIGSQASKERFSLYTGIHSNNLLSFESSEIHDKLDLNKGLRINDNTYINLLLMCCGISSKGTLKEVLRGYLGDRRSDPIYSKDDFIDFQLIPKIQASLFSIIYPKEFQRPFELATRRLENMIEILRHWHIYNPAGTLLTQRGGTFLFENTGKLLYSYRPISLLRYSETMYDPLAFFRYIDRN